MSEGVIYMAHISYEHSGVDACYTALDSKDIVIELEDAAYAKAEQVLFHPDTNSVYAVMHEGVFLIGNVPSECAEHMLHQKEIILSAHHFSGAVLRLKAAVVCTH